MGSKTSWIAMGQEDESSRAGRDGYLGVSGKGEIARHAAQRRRRQKRVGCSTADRRISIINTLHALTGLAQVLYFVVVGLLLCV